MPVSSLDPTVNYINYIERVCDDCEYVMYVTCFDIVIIYITNGHIGFYLMKAMKI